MSKPCAQCGAPERAKNQSYCQPCYRARQNNYRNTPRGRASALVASAKARASKLGLPYDLDTDWGHEKIARGTCEVTGLQFDLHAIESTTGFICNRSPSIHRFKPEAGYTKDNCLVVAWCFNEIAGKYDPTTLATIFERAAVFYDGRVAQMRCA